MEGLIPIAIAAAFPDFLFSHKQSRPYSLLSDLNRADLSSQSPVTLYCSSSIDVPHYPSRVKPRPWAQKLTLPSSDHTTLQRFLLDMLTSAISPLHESRRKSTLQRDLISLVQSSMQHALYSRKIQTPPKRILIILQTNSSSTYRQEPGRP